MPENEMRFSDTQLAGLRQDVDELARAFEQHKAEQDKRWSELASMVETTARMVQDNTAACKALESSTADVVRVFRDVEGAVRIGAGIQKTVATVAKLGTVGAVIAAAAMYVINSIKGP